MAEKSWVLCTGMRCHIWRNSVDFVDIRSTNRHLFFRRLAFIVKSKLLLFLFAFFVLFCFVYRTPGIILTMNKGFNYSDTTWAPWRFRTKTAPNKRPKLCITKPLWGGGGGGLQSSVGYPQKGPLMRKTFPCYAGESVWNQGRISNTMYRNLCWIP